MNTTAHTILSASIATSLALFTVLSAAFAGLAATPTLTGLSLFVAVGVIEIMIQSYAPPSGVLNRARRPAGTAKVVRFPAAEPIRKAA